MKITKTVAADQARRLAAALAARGVAIAHTKALDLVCAAHGLRSRNALAAEPEGGARPDEARLAAVTAPLARHDAGRLAAILAATTALTHPARAVTFAAGLDRGSKAVAFSVPSDAPRDVVPFLATPAGADCVAAIAKGYCHYRYWRDGNDSPMSLKDGSKLAEALLTRGARSGGEVLAEHYGWGLDALEDVHQQGTGKVYDYYDALDGALREAGLDGLGDREDWHDGIVERVADRLDEEDDSRASDLLGSHDRAEVVFVFGMGASDCEDVALQAGGHSMAASDVLPDDNLRATLAAVGYTMTEYRALSGNRRPTAGRTVRRKVRADRVAPWEAVRDALDNASSGWCNLVLYAQVPVSDMVDLDPKRPIRLRGATFASYNAMSGTFYGDHEVDDVVLDPSQGFLATCHGWYGPDEICGLVGSAFAGRVENAGSEGGAEGGGGHG